MKIDEKRFDCVEMKRRIQMRIFEETKGMSAEEIVAYFHKRVQEGPFADLWLKAAAEPPQPSSRSSVRT